jgi:hypothetical protein
MHLPSFQSSDTPGLASLDQPAGGSSEFLGDPPPDPRFLASLGALSSVELHHCCVVDLLASRQVRRMYSYIVNI